MTTKSLSPTKTRESPSKYNMDSNQEFLEALDDVHSRFILNLPPAELSSSDRIFFQLEQAFWFYEDFYVNPTDPNLIKNENLPKFRYLYPFAQKMFHFSPLLQPLVPNFQEMWNEFSSYKRSISTYGTILLNEDCTKVILCQDWYGKSWTFPAGKVNQNEVGIDAASRETYEETGFDINCIYGESSKYNKTWNTLSEEDALAYTEDGSNKRRTCYVCKGVPDTFPFHPVARKEVSQVSWIALEDLNSLKTFAVLPFIFQLRSWIRKNTGEKNTALDGVIDQYKKERSDSRANSRIRNQEYVTPNTKKKKKKDSNSRPNSRSNSRGNSRPSSTSKKRNNTINPNDIFLGDTNGWSEKDMFLANEKLLGRKIEYDGNPHEFWNEQADDPHKFHIVGGSFMNAPSSTPPPSMLQDDNDDDDPLLLKPFFSTEGKTPWGEKVELSMDFSNVTTQQVREQITSIESTFDTLPNKKKSRKTHDDETNHWNSLLYWVESFGDVDCKKDFKFDIEAIFHAMNVAIINHK